MDAVLLHQATVALYQPHLLAPAALGAAVQDCLV
jgi:hypothetical protein